MTEEVTIERVYPPKLMFMVVNPLMRWALGTGFGKKLADLALLEFEGRNTGNTYTLVSGIHSIDGKQAILTNSGWRHNFTGGHPLTATIGGETVEMVGTLQRDPANVARVYAEKIEALGTAGASRRLGIKIEGEGEPTLDQLTHLARQEGLSVIYLEPAVG